MGQPQISEPGAAFGLAVEIDFPCPGLEAPGAVHSGCRVQIERVAAADPGGRDAADWVQIGEDRLDDGTVTVTLEHHPELGYRFAGAPFGCHLISRDGRRIRSSVAGVDRWLLERFVIGKLLPLAAVTQGLEIIHASAAVLEDRVLACVGASGAGKSSVATRLLLDGARFFADDVLSLSRQGEEIRAYPGSSVLNVRGGELSRLSGAQQDRLGQRIEDRDDRVTFKIQREPRALPLGGIYLLDRSEDWDELTLVASPDPPHLLACTYDTVTRRPDRLINLLDISALISRLDLLRVVRVPRGSDAAAVAELVRRDFLDR